MTERLSQIINTKQNTSKMQDFFNNYNNDPNDINKANTFSNNNYQMPERFNSYSAVNLKDNYNYENNNNDINSNDINLHKKYSITRKNNILNYKSNSYNSSDYYVEPIHVFIDDNSFRNSEIIFMNHECKFVFDHEVETEFINLLHFTQNYFEFPIFYFFKGSYSDDSKITTITLKDYRSFKIRSNSNKIYKKLKDFANNTLDFFKYAHVYKLEQEMKKINYQINGWNLYDPQCEYLRQGIEFSNDKFCFSEKNLRYKLCETYPNILVIPKKFDNEEIFKIAGSRMKNRFPVLTYFYHKNDENKIIKSYLFRSSQIKTGGFIFKGKNVEIEYINKLTNIDNNNQGFMIFDCRPFVNAKANTFKGAGVEEIKSYQNCKELKFGCIENIHNVRQSLKKALLKAYYGKESIVKGKVSFNIDNSNMKNFLSKFEDTKWLEYLSDLLLGAIIVSNNLKKGINVLVHCSDGWDRTAQICSLVQIILDPFFRTIEGFAILIEKEWVSFGHQFATRNGCDFRKEKKKERSPIFIQFIHAVYQMTVQFPTVFEFNSNMLLFLCNEIYSNKYGTFLCNSEKDLNNYKIKETTLSIWSEIIREKNKYINDIYKKLNEPINIKGEMQYLNIWNEYFFQYDKLGRVHEDGIVYDKGEYLANILDDKKKNILELIKVIQDNGLEDKIKNNKLYEIYKNELNSENK